MVLIIVKSKDPDLSFHIHKNPDSLSQVRSIPDECIGVGFWSKNKREYVLQAIRRDPTNPRYYLDYSIVSEPYYYYVLFNEFLRINTKNTPEGEMPQCNKYKHTVIFNMIKVNKNWLDQIIKFAELDIQPVWRNINHCELTVAGEMPFQHFMIWNITILLLIISHQRNYLPKIQNKQQITKFAEMIGTIDPPYMIRYLLKRELIPHNSWNRINSIMNKTNRYDKLEMVPGTNFYARCLFIQSIIQSYEGLPIIDIGCGEGKVMAFLNQYIRRNDIQYIGYDIDQSALNQAKTKAQRVGITTCRFYNDWDQMVDDIDFPRCAVILSEVIEHIPIETAETIIHRILQLPYSVVIITTPNKDFNKYYNTTRGVRYSDHLWEMGTREFTEWLDSNTPPRRDIGGEVKTVGDVVNDVQPTMCVVMRRD